MAAVVATEATRIVHVADMVGMRSPRHLHEREDVLRVEGHERRARGLDQCRLGGEDIGVGFAIEAVNPSGIFTRASAWLEYLALMSCRPSLWTQGRLGLMTPSTMARLIACSAVTNWCAARLWQSMQSMTRRWPFGHGAAGRQRTEDGLRAIGVGTLDPRNVGQLGVSGDVLDVAKMDAVDAATMREGVFTAEVENQHRLGFSVLLVVGKVREDQQLVADRNA